MVPRKDASSAIFMKKPLFFYCLALSCFAVRTIGQTTTPAPAARRAAEVDSRGDEGMGFSHYMTGHHFHLYSDGGAIEVESNSPDDDTSKAAHSSAHAKNRRHVWRGGLFPAYVYPRHCSARRGNNEAPKRSNRLHHRQHRQRRASANSHQEPESVSSYS